ncbi:MAG: hypothetical protein V1662_03730, partial [Candidatus Omnitrophota bacterium]
LSCLTFSLIIAIPAMSYPSFLKLSGQACLPPTRPRQAIVGIKLQFPKSALKVMSIYLFSQQSVFVVTTFKDVFSIVL